MGKKQLAAARSLNLVNDNYAFLLALPHKNLQLVHLKSPHLEILKDVAFTDYYIQASDFLLAPKLFELYYAPILCIAIAYSCVLSVVNQF